MTTTRRPTDPIAIDLAAARIKAGLTQAEVADAAGIARASLCNYEAGKQQPPLGVLRRWMQALGLAPAAVSLTYRPGFEHPQTAPSLACTPAGNGATPSGLNSPPVAPASAQVEVGSDLDRADVAPVIDVPSALAERCPRCEGTRTEAMRWVGPGAGDWRGIACTSCSPVARTLDVAERTAGQAFAAGLGEMGAAMAAEVRRTNYSALPTTSPVERGPAHDPPPGPS